MNLCPLGIFHGCFEETYETQTQQPYRVLKSFYIYSIQFISCSNQNVTRDYLEIR